jgi:hexosaminidase
VTVDDAVVPRPTTVTTGSGSFTVTSTTRIAADAAAADVAQSLADLLRRATGFAVPVGGETGSSAVVVTLDAAAAELGAEGYELTIGDAGVQMRARESAGLFHGVQTLRQLLPPSGPVTFAGTHVVDVPRYPWRGTMLDVSRHFFGVDAVKRYIDDIAAYKLNVLHLHLSDDQGWRIAIDGRPRLTDVGGRTQVGGGAGGFYTQAQYADIVSYAQDRFITVVPEIDMPGHANAALASYAELNCDGKARELYTGIEVGFSSFCVDSDATYAFLDEVLGQLAALTPGEYLHVGGDEVQTLTHEQYVHFIERVQAIVTKHGKKLIGWEEVAQAKLAPGSVVQYWNTNGPHAATVRDAAARGAHVVLSPANRAYLDMKYDDDYALGLEWAGRVSVRMSYEWDPATVIDGLPAGAVLGVEAPLWSETLTTIADVESMAFPRLAAVAEVGWSGPHRDWESFSRRLAAQAVQWHAERLAFHQAPGVPWPAAR